MAGINIYLTEKERNIIVDYVTEYMSVLGEGEDTCEYIEKDLKNGLGSALYKLYKGRIGQRNYEEYKKGGMK